LSYDYRLAWCKFKGVIQSIGRDVWWVSLVMSRGRKGSRKKPGRIRVESSRVYVVPYAGARSFFREEIEQEGFQRIAGPLIVMHPRHEVVEVQERQKAWVARIFAALWQVRESYPPETLGIRGLIAGGRLVDVGLIDIPVTCRGPPKRIREVMAAKPMALFEENLTHIDGLFAGTYDDQMTLVSCLHVLRPDGVPEVHFHNVIFGVRREFRDGVTRTGPLDFRPLLGALGKRLRLSVIACGEVLSEARWVS
jgi:hypothetical protein